MRVIVTGGGTGGHIYPAIAVCEALMQQDAGHKVLYVGGSSGMETDIVPAANIPFQAVTARKMPLSPSLATVRGMVALAKGYTEARAFVRAFGADVVVGTGGYAAAAVVLAAARMGTSTIILENNVVPGRTNLRLGKRARTVCVSFEETMQHFPKGRCVLTGMPLRDGIVAAPELTKPCARARFDGLEPDRFTILVIGGSQGARGLNTLAVAAAPRLTEHKIQILHQTGKDKIDEVNTQAETAGLSERDGYVSIPFIDTGDMPAALRSADIIVCRGGMSTLSEACAAGLPALVVPLPTAYKDHQTANAMAMQRLGAAICLPQQTLTGQALAELILELHGSPDQISEMARVSLAEGRPNAAREVAKIALEQGK